MGILRQLEGRFQGLDCHEIFKGLVSCSPRRLCSCKLHPRGTSFFLVGAIHPQEEYFDHKKIKSKYIQRTHKYGIRGPKSVKEAQEVDKQNCNTLWMDSVRLEMTNNRIEFEDYKGDMKDLVGYEEITGHLIYDVKLAENFRRKTAFVASGHLMDLPSFITYSTVVSWDSVRILLLVSALKDLEVMGDDIQNAFLSALNL